MFQRTQVWAPLPQTTRSQAVHLSVDSKGDRLTYCCNKSVFIRSFEDPADSVQYTQHAAQTTAANISPSGYYVASADVNGTVRVWDAVGEDNILKNEVKVISGRINDLAWDGESKRIIAVGNGRERYGHCFTFDSGNTVGEISGHSAAVNAVAIRQQRPFRAATAGDDNSIVFYTAFPCRYEKTLRVHSRFVHEVRYAPNGEVFVSVGGDGKVCVFDGKTGDLQCSLENEHKGSVFACSYNASSKHILTSSADQTAKLWDLEAQKVVQTWQFGEPASPQFQQMGNAWAKETPISLSLSGDLHYLDPSSGKVARTLSGHQRAITSMGRSDGTFFTGSYEGRVCHWDANGNGDVLAGSGHTNEVVAFASSDKDQLYSAGKDDRIHSIDATVMTFTGSSIISKAQPRGLAVLPDGHVIVVTEAAMFLYRDGKEVAAQSTAFAPTAVSSSADGLIAVGAEDNSIHLFTYSSNLKETATLSSNRSAITALSFHPTLALLAAGDGGGKVVLYDASTHDVKTSRWGFQTARVASLSWNAAGTHVASASLDTSIVIYSVERPLRNLIASNTHKEGVSGVSWVDEGTLLSTGADATVKRWRVKLP